MDRRPIRRIFAQIKTKLLLCAAAYGYHDVLRTMLFNKRKKISIFDIRTVRRRDITVLPTNQKGFAARLINERLARAFVWKNPKNFSPLTVQLAEKMFQIFETGNALDALTSQQAPYDDHQTAVSNRHIGRNNCAPIPLVFAQSRETGSRRSYEKSSILKHRRDRFIDIAVEEPEAENLSSRNH